MINKIIISFLILLLIPAGIFWYNYQHAQVSLPFNCLYSTEYFSNNKGIVQKLNIKQYISFNSSSHAYFLLNGTAATGGQIYKINRTILLDEGEIEHGGKTTFKYKIKSVNKNIDDDLPEDIFENLMSEYTLTSDIFELRVYPQGRETYLLGGTFSYLSVCLRD